MQLGQRSLMYTLHLSRLSRVCETLDGPMEDVIREAAWTPGNLSFDTPLSILSAELRGLASFRKNACSMPCI
jgi:hypothetical protein